MTKLFLVSVLIAGVIVAVGLGIYKYFIVRPGTQGTISERGQIEESEITIVEPTNNLPNNQLIVNEITAEPEAEAESEIILPDWILYRNETYKFAMQHPKEWQNEEYGPFQSGFKLHQTLFVWPKELPERKVWWQVNVWKLNTPDSEIISDSMAGLRFIKENDLIIGGWPAKEKVYYGPSQAMGGMHYYRLYIVRNNDYAFSMTSDLCMDEKKPECDKVIEHFEFLR